MSVHRNGYCTAGGAEGIEVDQSFVRGIPGSGDDVAIVTAIIGLARSLNLRMIVEGVETEDQADQARRTLANPQRGNRRNSVSAAADSAISRVAA